VAVVVVARQIPVNSLTQQVLALVNYRDKNNSHLVCISRHLQLRTEEDFVGAKYRLTQVVVVVVVFPRCGDSVDDTVDENSSVFSLIRMRWLPSARHSGTEGLSNIVKQTITSLE